MTVEELQDAWADLQAWRADQLALRTPPAPSGRAVDVAAYLTTYRAMTATFGTPGRAQAAVRAWQQAGADLLPADRARLDAWVGAQIAAREGGA